MELTEKNGQASMEEILASIRRIIAEEPSGSSPVIDLDAPVRQVRGDGLLDDPSDFDLPSMFRVPAPAAPERATPLFGRLSEAIRAASSASHAGDTGRAEPSLSSLRLHRTETSYAADENGQVNGHAAGPAFLLSTFHDTTVARADDPAAGQPVNPAQEVEAALAATRLVQAAPEVPRQMMAFKDSRFRGMGAAPHVAEPTPQWPTHFESPVAAQPASEPVELHAHAAAPAAPVLDQSAHGFAGTYPAFQGPEPAAEPPMSLTPPPPPPVAGAPAHYGAHDASAESFKAAPIEDATADLLRPMLRQWLADNMPRMVEKALHIEVAESVKGPKK